ncbi:MAG: flagellar basal-body rod protein FlgG [Candidatus Dadabacteria bacterium]|nr:MAG: flagellar basal-body rod protein FlgG [Candidatus Dadabacteria bacterium]
MIKSLFTAATGMRAQELNINVIANNLANVNTTGFKKSRAEFQDLVYQTITEPGAPTSDSTRNPSGIQVGLGTKTSAVKQVFSQGDLKSTGNQLDIAIEGEGFFQVTLPDGTLAYTRAGAFQLDENGQVVTADGFVVEPAITIPPDALSVTIGQDGVVNVLQPGSPTPTQVGQFQLTRFQNPAGLKQIGKNLLLETQSSGTPTTGTPGENGMGRLAQGFLESSNVSVVEEVVNMIQAQKAYESSSKAINTADQMIQQALNVKR